MFVSVTAVLPWQLGKPLILDLALDLESIGPFASSEWSKVAIGDLCLLFVKMDLVVLEQGVGCIIVLSSLSFSEESLGVRSRVSTRIDIEADGVRCWFCFNLRLNLLMDVFLMFFLV